jgi:hypothetical protein
MIRCIDLLDATPTIFKCILIGCLQKKSKTIYLYLSL